MRFLFVALRFHTNQYGAVASLGRHSNKKIIRYTQDPLYRLKERVWRISIQKVLLNLISRVRIPPVLGQGPPSLHGQRECSHCRA